MNRLGYLRRRHAKSEVGSSLKAMDEFKFEKGVIINCEYEYYRNNKEEDDCLHSVMEMALEFKK